MSSDAAGSCNTIFVGAVEEGRRCLEALLETGEPIAGIVTLKDEWARQTSGAVPFDEIASRHGIPLLKVRDMNHPGNVRRLEAMEPDLILVIGWTRLVGSEILAMPARGCIGFHASLLPRYRGRAPVNWAIINGEKETGNSMIHLDSGVDTGDLVAQRRIPIEYEDTCESLYRKVADSAIDMLKEHLPALKSGCAPRTKQDDSLATIMGKRTPEDGLIDWCGSTRKLYDWIRALTHPYPGAFSYISGKKILIWSASEAQGQVTMDPGTITTLERDCVEVATGDGRLRLGEIQAEGEAEGPSGAAALKLGWSVGMRLGNPGGAAASGGTT